ncbi:MAG: hypothetical protein H5U16_12945 [Roseovarius sp.]|nr:hypothetical protein [Roseovarius sp.]
MTGRIWLVVGPSGAGKDSVLAGLAARIQPEDEIMLARRVITRPCQPGGAEQHLSVTPDGFARLDRVYWGTVMRQCFALVRLPS